MRLVLEPKNITEYIEALEKGRKADPIGTIKVWHGKKFIKQAKGWVPVVAGKRGRPAKTATAQTPATTPAVDPDQAKKDAAKKEALIVTLTDALDMGTATPIQRENYIAKLKELGVIYKPPKDEEYIKNADLNDLKTLYDFKSYDYYTKYAEKIFELRNYKSKLTEESFKHVTQDELRSLIAVHNLDIVVKDSQGGKLAHSMSNDIAIGDHEGKSVIIHELGHVIQNELEKIGFDQKLEDVVYSPSKYGITNGGEAFAENVTHYYTDSNYAAAFPEIAALLEKTIPAKYDKLARDIMAFNVAKTADPVTPKVDVVAPVATGKINKIKSLKFAMDGKEMTAEAKASKAELDRLMWEFTTVKLEDVKQGDVILNVDYTTKKSSWVKVNAVGRASGASVLHTEGKDGVKVTIMASPGSMGHKAMPVPEEIINKIKDLPGVTVETEEIPQADTPKTAKPDAQGVATAPVAPKTYAESKGLAKYDAGRLDALVQATTKRNRMSYGQDVQYQGTYFRNMTGKTGKLIGIGDGGYALVQFGSEVKTAAWRDLRAVGPLKPHSMYDGLTVDNVYQAEGQFKTDLDATMNQKIGSSNMTYLDLCKEFKKHGFTMNVVGGTVRDILAGKKAGDVDFIFDGTDRELAATLAKINPVWAKGAVTNAHLGLMSFSDGKDTVDITPVHKFITETNTMAKGWTLKDDAQSRDLAMNSLHVDPISGVAVDGTGKGLKDIETNTINFTDMKILEHTPVYLLRAFKFLARGYAISPESDAALNKNIKQIEKCSPRRISSFLTRQIGEKDGEKGLLKVKDLISARDPQLWQSKFEATYRNVIPKFRGK